MARTNRKGRTTRKKSRGDKTRKKVKPIKKPSKKIVRRTPHYRRLPGSKRRYRNLKTGRVISRRQYDKLHQRKRKRLSAATANANRKKLKIYLGLRDDFIARQKVKGKKLSKRDAMRGSTLKEIISDLRSSNARKKAKALFKLGRIDKEEIERYVKQFEAAA